MLYEFPHLNSFILLLTITKQTFKETFPHVTELLKILT